MDGGISDVEIKISTPLDTWVLDIKNRLVGQFPYLTEPREASITQAEILKRCEVTIYPSDDLPEKFDIGVHLYGCARKDPTWEYVAFMSQWLGFDLKLYLEDMKEKEDLARRCYMETDRWHLVSDSNCFLESLMVGSCFLGFAIVLFQKDHEIGIETLKGTDYISDKDLRSKQFKILYRKIMNPPTRTKLDMLNLGNQIPWFAVEAVFTRSNLHRVYSDKYSIEKLAMSCFDDLFPRVNKFKVQNGALPIDGFEHLLHIFYWTRTPENNRWEPDDRTHQRLPLKRFGMLYIPSATELLGSATVIGKLTSGFCDAEYSTRRISALMQIAPLDLFPYSHEIFSTLLKFEQHYRGELTLTVYIACMKGLLQTKEDVKLLQKNGIVRNTLKDEKEVLDFVQHFWKYLLEVDAAIPFSFIRFSDEVNEHHEKGLARCYAGFKSHFCPSRWVMISIIAGITLFALTVIQSLYTVLGYYKI
jgi:Plant protein of unknown function